MLLSWQSANRKSFVLKRCFRSQVISKLCSLHTSRLECSNRKVIDEELLLKSFGWKAFHRKRALTRNFNEVPIIRMHRIQWPVSFREFQLEAFKILKQCFGMSKLGRFLRYSSSWTEEFSIENLTKFVVAKINQSALLTTDHWPCWFNQTLESALKGSAF